MEATCLGLHRVHEKASRQTCPGLRKGKALLSHFLAPSVPYTFPGNPKSKHNWNSRLVSGSVFP
jgi:hypothetical protein